MSRRPRARVQWRAALLAASALALLIAACGRSPDVAFLPYTSTPPVADPAVRLVVIGDFGTGNDASRDVAASVRGWVGSEGADALLTTGDNAYPDGDAEQLEDAWMEPYGWVDRAEIPTVATLGNHDIRAEDGEPVMRVFGMPSRWFSHRMGIAEIFVLDGNRPDDPGQLRWLRRALARSTAVWKIALFHQPAFSCARHDGTPTIVARWVPEFEAEGVDLVLNGHDHNYQRFAPSGGVTYVVSGGGGAGLYGLDTCDEGTPPRVQGNDEAHHFLAIEGSSERMRVRAIGADGSTLDDFSLSADA